MATVDATSQKAANLISRLDRLPITWTNIRIAVLLTLVWLCEAFDVGIVAGVIIMVEDMWELSLASIFITTIWALSLSPSLENRRSDRPLDIISISTIITTFSITPHHQ